jgi:hypothetical protein
MACPFCKADNPEGNRYCGQCGGPLDPIVGRLQNHLESSVKLEVERTLEARLKDQKVVELETSLAIAERLSNWAKLFGASIGIPVAVLALALGFLGFRTYRDFAELIRGAQEKINPKLEQATREAETAVTKAKEASSQVQKLSDLAEQTSQSFSEASKKLAEVSTLSGEVSQLKSRASDVQKQLAQASELTGEVKGLTSKVSQLEQRFSKIGRVTILTNRADRVRSLVGYLAGYGAESAVLSPDELGKIGISEPDLVVVSTDTADAWFKQPQWALKKVFENYKVVGMGQGSSQLFSVLGLEINSGQAAHSPSGTPLIVEVAALLKSPLSISSSDNVLQVAQTGSDSIGVYDEGSPDIAGFEGIARWSNSKNHWPIARQGNYVLWGFDSPVEQMTDAGKRLLVNLLISHKLRPAVPLSQARKKHEYVQPGLISERLNVQFPTNRFYFQVRQPGHISAKLSWSPPERPLALILNGPGKGQDRPFARKDGVSPVEIGFDVTDAQVSTGVDWQIALHWFENIGNATLTYSLELSFPASGPSLQ